MLRLYISLRNAPALVIAVLCALLLSRLATGASVTPPQPRALAVYTHAQLNVESLSDDVLRSIFAMRLTVWPDGTRIQVFVLPDEHPLHRQFSKSELGLFPYQLRQTWDQGVFSGTGEAPIQVDNVDEMRERLATTPGAIGYLPEQRQPEGVKRAERP